MPNEIVVCRSKDDYYSVVLSDGSKYDRLNYDQAKKACWMDVTIDDKHCENTVAKIVHMHDKGRTGIWRYTISTERWSRIIRRGAVAV